MRLFIGIELQEEARLALFKASQALLALAKGNFSRRENLHITLCFLGEKDPQEIAGVQSAMAQAAKGVKPMELKLDLPGRFDRGAESIVWCGVSGDVRQLYDLARALGDALEKNGITFDKGAFKPHITLARRVKTQTPWEEVYKKMAVQNAKFTVGKITLFESTRINSLLTYVPLHTQIL